MKFYNFFASNLHQFSFAYTSLTKNSSNVYAKYKMIDMPYIKCVNAHGDYTYYFNNASGMGKYGCNRWGLGLGDLQHSNLPKDFKTKFYDAMVYTFLVKGI